MILGCAGAGKTTLARRLAEQTGARLILLDAIWREDWTDTDVPTFRALMSERHAADAWISDGNFAAATFDIRLPRADLVVWLEPPRWLCAWRAVTRVFRPGEPHRLERLWRVLSFIRNFDRVNRPRIEALRMQYAPTTPVVRLRTSREIASFVA